MNTLKQDNKETWICILAFPENEGKLDNQFFKFYTRLSIPKKKQKYLKWWIAITFHKHHTFFNYIRKREPLMR